MTTCTVQDVLVRRFIDRSQRFRRAGAIVGLVLVTCSLVLADAVDGSGVHLDLLLLASFRLAGSIAGSIVAEASGSGVPARGPPRWSGAPRRPNGTGRPSSGSGCCW